jgi:hypothetical protein
MSMYAVERYVSSILNGMASPTLPAAQAWVLPPPVTQPVEAPQFYVWGGGLNEQRATLSRGTGQKRIEHSVKVFVQWIGPNDDGDSFPLLLDAARALLRAVPLPVQLTDPYTGESSSLQDFGESIRLEHPTPQALKDQRFLQHAATLTLACAEWIGGA